MSPKRCYFYVSVVLFAVQHFCIEYVKYYAHMSALTSVQGIDIYGAIIARYILVNSQY